MDIIMTVKKNRNRKNWKVSIRTGIWTISMIYLLVGCYYLLSVASTKNNKINLSTKYKYSFYIGSWLYFVSSIPLFGKAVSWLGKAVSGRGGIQTHNQWNENTACNFIYLSSIWPASVSSLRCPNIYWLTLIRNLINLTHAKTWNRQSMRLWVEFRTNAKIILVYWNANIAFFNVFAPI